MTMFGKIKQKLKMDFTVTILSSKTNEKIDMFFRIFICKVKLMVKFIPIWSNVKFLSM